MLAYLPVEDANDAVFTGEGDHAVVSGPGGLQLTESADFRGETEDLKGVEGWLRGRKGAKGACLEGPGSILPL